MNIKTLIYRTPLKLVLSPSDATAKKSKEIGESVGFNLENAVEGFGLSAFEDNTLNSNEFRFGFDTGFDFEASKVINFTIGLEKGGGAFTAGFGFGRNFRKEGKLNPFEPEIKGTALIQIKPE